MQTCSYFYLYRCKRAVFSKITALLQDNPPNGGATQEITALLQDGALPLSALPPHLSPVQLRKITLKKEKVICCILPETRPEPDDGR
ncbi:hypothetical protein D3C75_1175790 [compost metagenome]